MYFKKCCQNVFLNGHFQHFPSLKDLYRGGAPVRSIVNRSLENKSPVNERARDRRRPVALPGPSAPSLSVNDPPPPRKPTQPKMFHTVKVFWYKFQDLGVGGAWAGQGGVKKIGLSKLSHLVTGCYVPTLSLFKFH